MTNESREATTPPEGTEPRTPRLQEQVPEAI
jgi:hypothetical protein